jgi:hypothetical protein
MVHLTEVLFDCIVIGSGPSGAMCAQTLTEAGRKTLLLDAGITGSSNSPLPENADFLQIRTNSAHQEEIFLGKQFEGIDWGPAKAGSQLTPARKFVIEKVNELLPLDTNGFYPCESLAYGGLGAAWGLGCFKFSPAELEKADLPVDAINRAYQVVAERIGISYTPDDIDNYAMPGVQHLLPSISIDDNASSILQRYERRKSTLNQKNFFLGVTPQALLTKDKDHRKATDYSNMDFYDNRGLSAYRPNVTIDVLKKAPNFLYQSGVLVTTFEENEECVKVSGIIIDTNEPITFRTRKLLLATNVLSTARIVLRSFKKFGHSLPLLCNPYSYLTCLITQRLGKVATSKQTSSAQLSLFHDRDNTNVDIAMASLYSYSSLMLYRALKEVPLNFKDALQFMQYIIPATLIAGIHHPDAQSQSKYVQLKPHDNNLTGDILHTHYSLASSEKKAIEQREKLFGQMLFKLGCLPLKKITPAIGSSIHYAGTLPFSKKEDMFTVQPGGRLSQTKNIFVADGSGFTFLPAKGITLTLMANAHNTALNVLQHA